MVAVVVGDDGGGREGVDVGGAGVVVVVVAGVVVVVAGTEVDGREVARRAVADERSTAEGVSDVGLEGGLVQPIPEPLPLQRV